MIFVFGQAAVGLNRVENLLIENCEIKRNRQTVPVVGKFSAARYIRYVYRITSFLLACCVTIGLTDTFVFCCFTCTDLMLNI
jgi:hypothetical protein